MVVDLVDEMVESLVVSKVEKLDNVMAEKKVDGMVD